MQGCTTIISTHRLAELERADEILVLCEGRVVERGSQAELLQQEGLFWQMWETQQQFIVRV
jgi:ABC-type multidrug transport system fused ATPase/permease subunit